MPTALLALLTAGIAPAQEITVTGRLIVLREPRGAQTRSPADAVVWLLPLSNWPEGPLTKAAAAAPRRFRLVQKNKRFDPHVLVVPEGSVVDFPNHDPLFHNVFSLFDGKRFDLGLYESGSTRAVAFDRPGVCYIFCNIHPDMSAVVLVLDTPYYAVPNENGVITIPNVPPGRYRLRVWSERSSPDSLIRLTRDITLSPAAPSLGTIQLKEPAVLPIAHKNKYGRDYDPPAPSGALYRQP